MAKHTPGPWLHVGNTVYTLTRDRRGNEVNRFYANVQASHQTHEATAEELEANARMIATSPKMLAALERLADTARCAIEEGRWLSIDGRKPEIMALDEALAVIAEATTP